MIHRAKEVASNYFNRNQQEDDTVEEVLYDEPAEDKDSQYVMLEDGRRARIKIP
jgi:hypothetical protein